MGKYPHHQNKEQRSIVDAKARSCEHSRHYRCSQRILRPGPGP